MEIVIHLLGVFSIFAYSTLAANCNLGQPRSDSDPSGAAIGADLRGQDNSLINNVCNGGFPPGSNTISTWNTGSQVYNVTRTDPNQPLQYCFDAFDDIISQCIENDNYWGGDWELGDEIYAIYDSEWPSHILQSELQSSASAAAATSTPPGATVITTTIDGSPITQTYVPTTITGASPTTSSTTVDGVVVPLIIGAGGIAFIPFVPVGGAPPAAITPPSAPSDGDDPGNSNSNSEPSSTASTSVSSSRSSQLPLQSPEDVLPVDPNTATFDPVAATQIVFFGVASPTPEPPSSTSSSTPPPPPPPTSTVDPNAAAKQECHDRCSSNPSLTTPDGQWCIANCGCFLGAAGC